MPRMPLTEKDTIRLRREAQAFALDIFAATGFQGITMRGIGKRMGLTAMALYRYFPEGKGEIIESLRCQGFESLAEIFKTIEKKEADPFLRLKKMLRGAATFSRSNPSLYRLMFDITQAADAKEGSPLAEARALAWRPIEVTVGECIDQGILEGDKKVLPHILVAALHGTLTFDLSNQPYPERSQEVLFEPLLEILLRGSGANSIKTIP